MTATLLDRFGGGSRVSPEALASLGDRGLPTQKWENWRFTPISRRLKPSYRAAPAITVAREAAPDLGIDCARAVLVNGRFHPELSDLSGLGQGVEARAIADGAPAELGSLTALPGRPFAALNAAAFADGIVLRLKPGARAARPLHLVSLAETGDAPVAFYPRLLILAERGAEATVIESHGGTGAYLTSTVSEIRLDDGASLTHLRLQDDGEDGVHVAQMSLALAARARYAGLALAIGRGLSRLELAARLAGEGASFDLAAVSLGGGRGHWDVTTEIEHEAPATRSRQLVKCVLGGRGRGVYQGKVKVARGAIKTDAHQLSRALLLSGEAEADLKPELEIFAGDVKCGHGATVGELDAEALFYLRSRGISLSTARRLLIEAFVGDAVAAFGDEGLRAAAQSRLDSRLGELLA